MLFLINTALTAFKQSRPDLMAGQLQITAAEHSCLRYDSWLDCAEPHGYDISKLTAAYEWDRGIVRGHISVQLRKQIIDVLETSRVIEKRKVAWLLAALRQALPE